MVQSEVFVTLPRPEDESIRPLRASVDPDGKRPMKRRVMKIIDEERELENLLTVCHGSY